MTLAVRTIQDFIRTAKHNDYEYLQNFLRQMQAKLTNAKALDEITLDTILERVGGDKFVKKNSNKNKEQTCP